MTIEGISPADLLAGHGVTLRDSVPLGVPIPHKEPGVYVVGLHRDPADRTGLPQAPITEAALREWMVRVPELRLWGEPTNTGALAAHIAKWWLPRTSVLYIGKAGTWLRTRVHQFVKTPIGARSPHAGGQWLKTLLNNAGLTVHYALLPHTWAEAGPLEDAMLSWFVQHYQPVPSAHPEPMLMLPWANLVVERPNRQRREHGIKPATV